MRGDRTSKPAPLPLQCQLNKSHTVQVLCVLHPAQVNRKTLNLLNPTAIPMSVYILVCNGSTINPECLLSTLMHAGTVGNERTWCFPSSWGVTLLQQTLGELCDLRVWRETNLINSRSTRARDLMLFALLTPKCTLKLRSGKESTQLKTMHTQSYKKWKSKPFDLQATSFFSSHWLSGSLIRPVITARMECFTCTQKNLRHCIFVCSCFSVLHTLALTCTN